MKKVSTAKVLVLLSPEDEDLRQYCCWSARKYIAISVRKKVILLHRYILSRAGVSFLKEDQVDHINGLPLDNRRENLRVVTNQINSINKRSLGVHYHKATNKWVATFMRNYQEVYLGLYPTREEAEQVARKFLEEEGINCQLDSKLPLQ